MLIEQVVHLIVYHNDFRYQGRKGHYKRDVRVMVILVGQYPMTKIDRFFVSVQGRVEGCRDFEQTGEVMKLVQYLLVAVARACQLFR